MLRRITLAWPRGPVARSACQKLECIKTSGVERNGERVSPRRVSAGGARRRKAVFALFDRFSPGVERLIHRRLTGDDDCQRRKGPSKRLQLMKPSPG